MSIFSAPSIAFLPYPKMESYLLDELYSRFHYEGKTEKIGELLCIEKGISLSPCTPYWASAVMLNPCIAQFTSIGNAASILRSIQRNWASIPYTLFRRTALIQEKLPYINTKPLSFPAVIPHSKMGLYTLLDEHTMLYSAETTSTLPCGRLSFIEDREGPPSRAYLKLQEALTYFISMLHSPLPNESSVCLDAGACPGGWSWVLRGLGCKVIAVDREPLQRDLMCDSNITFICHDAFTIPPKEIGKCDWVLSDVACYPKRLLEWVKKWIDSGLASNMICTIKIQGKVDYTLINEFASLPNSIVLHLNANKHELTFLHRKET